MTQSLYPINLKSPNFPHNDLNKTTLEKLLYHVPSNDGRKSI